MITHIEALKYKCLKYVKQPLSEFHVMVGANGTGKTTFLDVISFLSHLLSKDLQGAINERTLNFLDLPWQQEEKFELAIELAIPENFKKLLADKEFHTIRYEICVHQENVAKEYHLSSEKVLLKKGAEGERQMQRALFPEEIKAPESIISPKAQKDSKTIVNKIFNGNDNFYDETGKGWDHAFKLGPKRSALRNLPEDESKFPVSTWLKNFLKDGVTPIVLNSKLMRSPSPPGQTKSFLADGSNLPWVIRELAEQNSNKFYDWIQHLKSVIPDLEKISTYVRPEDKHCFLQIEYANKLIIPSWMVSDGTLRLLALTLLPYLPNLDGIYLIEEPENGIHPKAIEGVFQSLSSVYDAQVMVATHSPVILSIVHPKQVICFSKTQSGATDMVSGENHPALREWQGETDLGLLFAGGVFS